MEVRLLPNPVVRRYSGQDWKVYTGQGPRGQLLLIWIPVEDVEAYTVTTFGQDDEVPLGAACPSSDEESGVCLADL